MLLFLKGFIIGIGKIIPGVSGAMLAINFNVYERLLDAVTNFFSDWKNNLKFLLNFGFGLILAIVLCSGIILFLMNNYRFVTLMFFIGLIFGGTYNFCKKLRYNYKNIIIILITFIVFLLFSINNFNNNYIIKNNFIDNIVFFIGGVIEIFASIVPGISGTSLLMVLGMYDDVLMLMSSVFDYNYVINNIKIYISYGLGMFISFIINSYLINYLIKRYKNISYAIILGLAIASMLILIMIVFKIKFTIFELILSIILLVFGMVISSILDK